MPTDKRVRHRDGQRQRQDAQRAALARAARRRTLRNLALLAALVIGLAVAVALTSRDDDGGDEVQAGATTSTTAGDEAGSTTTGPEPPADAAATFGPDGNDGAAPFQYGGGACPPAGGAPEPVLDFDAAPAQCIDPAKTYTAEVVTDRGAVEVALDTARTPGTTNNFVALARYGYYDGTALFRTEEATGIIQGGSPHTQDNADPGPGYALFDEGGPFVPAPEGDVYGPFQDYPPGTLAMARTKGPDTAGAQFFFVARDAQYLGAQGSYVIFGKVTAGLDVLEAVADLDDGTGKPSEPIAITSVTVRES